MHTWNGHSEICGSVLRRSHRERERESGNLFEKRLRAFFSVVLNKPRVVHWSWANNEKICTFYSLCVYRVYCGGTKIGYPCTQELRWQIIVVSTEQNQYLPWQDVRSFASLTCNSTNVSKYHHYIETQMIFHLGGGKMCSAPVHTYLKRVMKS